MNRKQSILRDLTFARYISSVNMTFNELSEWAKTQCSRMASLSREPIQRNLRLLSKNKKSWTIKDIRDAKKTISFIARHKGQSEGKKISKYCPYSKRFISLKNWGYDSSK